MKVYFWAVVGLILANPALSEGRYTAVHLCEDVMLQLGADELARGNADTANAYIRSGVLLSYLSMAISGEENVQRSEADGSLANATSEERETITSFCDPMKVRISYTELPHTSRYEHPSMMIDHCLAAIGQMNFDGARHIEKQFTGMWAFLNLQHTGAERVEVRSLFSYPGGPNIALEDCFNAYNVVLTQVLTQYSSP